MMQSKVLVRFSSLSVFEQHFQTHPNRSWHAVPTVGSSDLIIQFLQDGVHIGINR
jgi:hypothetical protein